MSLKQYYRKTVVINKSFIGRITDYFHPEDNESENESIVLETADGCLYEFYKEDIDTLTVI